MPCFNAEQYLGEAIDSVLRQTYTNTELIIIDDGSTDKSKQIAKGYGTKVRLIEQQNQGPFPARNRGIAESHGEFIAFLDADDYWSVDFLDTMYRALSQDDVALAYCGWQNIGLPGKRAAPYVPPDYESENKLELFLRSAAPWPIHAALTRKRLIEEVGGFDNDWSTCMDYDLWLRIAVTRQIKRVDKVMAFYRHHESGQITSKQWRQAYNVWLVKKKFVRAHPEVVANIPRARLRQHIDGGLLRRGYDAYWRRDLTSAQKIFRRVLKTRIWEFKDLKYLLPALLPSPLYQLLVNRADKRMTQA